jgi:hypothetical protein
LSTKGGFSFVQVVGTYQLDGSCHLGRTLQCDCISAWLKRFTLGSHIRPTEEAKKSRLKLNSVRNSRVNRCSIFGGIRKEVATHLDEQAINAACREEKYPWRERLFNPTNTVHLFILQILNRNTALNDLPRG